MRIKVKILKANNDYRYIDIEAYSLRNADQNIMENNLLKKDELIAGYEELTNQEENK